MYSFRPAKFQFLEEFQCIPLLHSSGAGKKQSRMNYQQPGNASQQILFLCWWWLSTDFLASALYPTAIAGKPKCQLVLVFGGSWKAEKPRRRSRDCVFAVKAWVREKENSGGLWHLPAQGVPCAECLGASRYLVGSLANTWFGFHSMPI